jgi:signal transduction histidine kinase/response regulator of citrate/malate metabolism
MHYYDTYKSNSLVTVALSSLGNLYRILLIEDNIGDARLVEIFLSESDLIRCEVVHKESLTDGLEALEKDQDYAAVLLDLTLPDSRGFDTLEKLLTRFPDVNVIVMTGLSDKELGIKAVKAGAQDFIVKGMYDSDFLSRTLRFSIERNSILKRLEETQRLANIGSWECDPSERYFTASEEVYRIVGQGSRENAVNYGDLENPESPWNIFEAIHQETVAEEGLLKKDIAFKAESGMRYIYIQCRKIIVRENQFLFQGIIQDITERKQSEELRKARDIAEQSTRMKEQWLANISHEMRTPMNAIIGMGNLIKQTILTTEQQEYIDSIMNSSEILLGIVNDILEVSSLQNSKIQLDYKSNDLYEILHSLVNAMQFRKKEKNLTINLEIGKDVPQMVVSDKLRLNQILYNIVGNAIKFTDSGFVLIKVENTGETNDSVRIRFTVTDSGIGIPPDKLDSVFETFTRIRSKARIYEGTGLGLAIVKNLVAIKGGDLGVESEPGKGSTFWFELELKRGKDTIAGKATTGTDDMDIDLNRIYRILLVEDHRMNQIVATKTIERQWGNMDIQIAENGQEAIELLQKEHFDLVLMDIQMPVMDGYEATAFIRQEMPHLAGLPILAMTAHAHVAKDENIRQQGFNDYVLKPFEPKDLFHKIIYYLNQSL